jgi:hypothetical protein
LSYFSSPVNALALFYLLIFFVVLGIEPKKDLSAY